MAGPTCEVWLESDDQHVLDVIDAILEAAAGTIKRTRKGRVWDVWIDDRPVHVWVEASPPMVVLAAGCNAPEDYAILRHLAETLAKALGGEATEPIK
jgi:hypothetical protein